MGKTYSERISEAKQLTEVAQLAAEAGISGLASQAERRASFLLAPIGRKRRKVKPVKSGKKKKGTARRTVKP